MKKNRLFLTLVLTLFFTLLISSMGFSQTKPLEYYIQTYKMESGYYTGTGKPGSNPVMVYSDIVELHNIPWLQIHFSDAYLGDKSYIILKSIKDNLWQRLDEVSIKQWNNYSAFFNGNAVEIKLFLASTDRQVFINIDEIVAGEWYQADPTYSICGPTDDRVSSNQPATARLLSVGCTAWIIPNGKFVSAGHCLDGSSATVVEFNVPSSLPNGTIQHPGPDDQYSVNVATKVFVNGGVGNDWGVFEVFPNSITSLMPLQAQNAYWSLVQDLGPNSIRITGYGVDYGTIYNQTQQTHVGPSAGSSGTTMRYATDTQGGNSGSPVIDALTNNALGVHTHGGCTSSGGNNNGTSTFLAAFWVAVDEGSGDLDNPTNFTTTTISATQIIVGFTPDIYTNNVVIVWNLSGTFTTPTGPPPAVGQPFAGGTLLYNGTTSPMNHTLLSPLTTYYYKAFSYNGAIYSSGIDANATTLPLTDFLVDFLVGDECNNSIILKFGTAPGATDCYDPGLDVSAPPPPPVDAFDARFISCGEPWFTDVRGTNLSGERVWNLHYQPATGCEPASLSWNSSQLPPTGYFHLVDPGSNNLVNVNMRTTNHYTDVSGFGFLRIKFNYQISSNFNTSAGWNMISLPINVTNNNYLSLFPSAVSGTLYGYSNGYFLTQTVDNCTGYWLKFPNSQIVQVNGTDRTECVISLNAGWNIIGGPNCNVPLNSIADPGGIIIPGTVYKYSAGYIPATSIVGTKAYWVKASGAGTITIGCGNVLAKRSNELVNSPEMLEDFAKIEISDAGKNSQTLYFGDKLNDNVNIESFSMPPKAPQGSFDVRLGGDYRLSESDEVTIELQATDYPISVTIENLNFNEEYVLVEISDGVEVRDHRIDEGQKIIISDKEVAMLKITKQQALPTTYNLEQNYPNPFNPTTTIKISLPEAANVKLSIYNALGQKVAELVNTNLETGWYNYQWDASNIASGIYIYELRTDKFISVKKMIFLK